MKAKTIWDAVLMLADKRVLTPDNVPLETLERMASLGYCYQSGRLFHVQPLTDRVAAALNAEGLFA